MRERLKVSLKGPGVGGGDKPPTERVGPVCGQLVPDRVGEFDYRLGERRPAVKVIVAGAPWEARRHLIKRWTHHAGIPYLAIWHREEG